MSYLNKKQNILNDVITFELKNTKQNEPGNEVFESGDDKQIGYKM